MPLEQTRSAGQGLERSCQADGSWIASARPSGGVELFRAWFAGKAYDTHRHDTYAIGLPVAWKDADSLPVDTWVRVQGPVHIGPFGKNSMPIIEARAVDESATKPAQPYLYP